MSASEIENLWWASLTHGGLLITPARLAEAFSGDLEPLDRRTEERLRRDITRLSEDEKSLGHLLDTVFEQVLGMKVMSKEAAVDKTWSRKLLTGEQFRPNRLWLGAHGDVFPIFVVRARGEATPRLGVGRGRREVSKVLEWLRHANLKVGLLTNGQQFRLIHAGADYEAWCEWDTDFWFEEGRPGPQLEALRRLVHVDVIRAPEKDKPSVLVEAILASRRGQAQLSGVLGERVRQAVETLIRASAPVIEPLLNVKKKAVTPNDVYIAATRLVMRLVVVLFAEARDLLPRDNPLYHSSYGLQGLREELDRAAGGRGNRLRQRLPSAWPRLLALFRLVSKGSGHEELPIPAYGGDLFAAGDAASADGISRALAALESAENQIRDDVIHQVLDYLTRSPVKVRQGKASTVVMQPVAFSDLSSEYIGILYEGLLDYELKPVQASDGCMVFLNIGDEPALPISRLERMDEKALKSLFEKLKANKAEDEGEEEEEEEEGAEGESATDDVDDGGAADAGIADESDAHREAVARVSKWAKKAVVAAGLVKVRNGREPDAADLADAQRKLVRRVLPAGEWFLVRWGGTRKGAGTFYTRPQLASPTVRRTLQPLAYHVVREEKDERTGLMEPVEWAPKKPEEILSLKVCDPAMGSGSFLVSALRFLTQALVESLYHHGRLDSKGPARTVCRLADGAVSGHPREELLPVPLDAPDFQERLRSRLKRHVVECCIYGVDLDPVAVELARLALWIETMNPQLPFEFLDHKLKCGNALVGCWFDRLHDYPIAAWERRGGDDAHTRFVHHFRSAARTSGKNKGKTEKSGDKWDAAISETAASRIYPELASFIRDQVQHSFSFGSAGASARAVHDDARKALEQMQRLAVHEVDRRAELYVTKFKNNDAVNALRDCLDAWCSLWFWPGDRLDLAPSPRDFGELPAQSKQLIRTISKEHRFFHWELEFPDVFTHPGAGFDAMIGNPPWDTIEPLSKEFFSNHDPLYRSYGTQEALEAQHTLFTHSAAIEDEWIVYLGRMAALGNFIRNAANPCGDDSSMGELHPVFRSAAGGALLSQWAQQKRARKRSQGQRMAPFRHQGTGKLQTFKLFSELALTLTHATGRVGLLLPSAIYSDKGSIELRSLLLEQHSWEWAFAFENSLKIFSIHRSFKFCAVIADKKQSGDNQPLRVSFGVRDPIDWETDSPRHMTLATRHVLELSPLSKTLIEVDSERDIQTLQKMYAGGSLVGQLATLRHRKGDFNVTTDAKLFPARDQWEGRGFAATEYGVWVSGHWRNARGRSKDCLHTADLRRTILLGDVDEVALPLHEGRMIGQFDFSSMGWVSGRGRGAKWREIGWAPKTVEPQFLIGLQTALSARDRSGAPKIPGGPRVTFMEISAATNSRTMISAVLPFGVLGDTVAGVDYDELDAPALTAILNSFVYDYSVRARCAGLHLSWQVFSETALPRVDKEAVSWLSWMGLRLSGAHRSFAPAWQSSPNFGTGASWSSHWLISEGRRRTAVAAIDAYVAFLFGLARSDFEWVLRDCGLEKPSPQRLSSKGFWRVDKELPPKERLPALALRAFDALNSEGPRALTRLVGTDTPDPHDVESWKDCELHANALRTLLGRLVEPEPPSAPLRPKSNKPQGELF